MAVSTLKLLDAAVEALGGTTRRGQVAMAEAVTKALESERHLAVQAGTGTGKSLAYLVPAIRHARETDTTVIISTATLALQRQLVDRDLPRLVEALEPVLGEKPSFAIMKGRNNYLCLNKVAQAVDGEALLDDSEISFTGRQVKRLHEWAQETETGDRDELDPGVNNEAWRQVSVTSQECLGAARCPHGDECFAELARATAHNVDVVVTNHALLAIDAMSDNAVLPEHDVVVIDEAHELDGRITSVATNEISARMLAMASNRASKFHEDNELKSLADDFVVHTEQMEPGRWTSIDQPTQGMLVGIRDELWKLNTNISPAPEGEASNDPERFAERQNLSNHLVELHDSLVRILEVFSEGSDEDVVWLERSMRGEDTLAVAPLSIAGLLATHLFKEQTVVLTSATLTLGGNFNAMAASWGLAKGSWDGLDVGSPFEPAKSGILYIAKHLPTPGRDGLAEATIEEMEQLIMAAGGRTLGLFSSRRAAEQAAQALRPRVPFEIFLQGDETLGVLVDRFAKQENACLFGTLSLWQGVDVPGSSLSLVLIDRIPFPRPTDPLIQARNQAANEAGRNGFMEVSATHAGLLMAQGAGRLLRSVDDRGVVAVLDNRLATKRYGAFLRASLPPLWTTTKLDVVCAALKRLVQG